MKRVSLLGILVLTAVVSYFFLIQEEDHSFKKSKIITTTGTKKLFLGARKSLPAPAQVEGQVAQDNCSDITAQLESIDFNGPIEDWLEVLDVDSLNSCKDPSTLEQIANLKKNCFDEFDEKACAQNAVFLRASLRTRNIEDGEDRELLADLILKEFSGKVPDFNKLTGFAEKLMDLDPEQKAYQKLWASSKIISQIGPNSSPTDVADEINDRVGEELLNDPDMIGLKLAMKTGFNPQSVEEFARNVLTQKDSSTMHEVLGWSLWRQNRLNEAVAELSRAIELNPNDKWLLKQLQKVQSKNANPDSYQARIQLGFDYQDLYN